MDSQHKIQTRKKFIGVGISSLALLSIFRFFIPKKQKKTETVKMLTQDGKLVEVAVMDLGCGKRKMISDEELKVWVKNK